jgi:hypothetical protein
MYEGRVCNLIPDYNSVIGFMCRVAFQALGSLFRFGSDLR